MRSKKLLHTSRKQRGFTLIEIMVVVVILAILATVVVQNLAGKPDEAKISKAKTDIAALESSLDLYRLDNGKYPSTDEGLDALMEKGGKLGESYLKKLPQDPWNNDYQYLNPGVHGSIDVYSLGADGAEGGEGIDADIGNW